MSKIPSPRSGIPTYMFLTGHGGGAHGMPHRVARYPRQGGICFFLLGQAKRKKVKSKSPNNLEIPMTIPGLLFRTDVIQNLKVYRHSYTYLLENLELFEILCLEFGACLGFGI